MPISALSLDGALPIYTKLIQGDSGLIPESEIEPVSDLPRLEGIDAPEDESLLRQTVVIKDRKSTRLKSLRHLVCRLLLEKKNKHVDAGSVIMCARPPI